jgi:hypothetical protein
MKVTRALALPTSLPERDITMDSGSLYASAVPAAIISVLITGFASAVCEVAF